MGERHTRRQLVRRGSAAALVVASTPALLPASPARRAVDRRFVPRDRTPREHAVVAQG